MNFSSNKIYILLFLFFGFVVVLFFLDPFSSYYEKFEGSIVDGVQYNIFGSPCTINQLAIDARQVENGEPIKYGCAPAQAPAPQWWWWRLPSLYS